MGAESGHGLFGSGQGLRVTMPPFTRFKPFSFLAAHLLNKYEVKQMWS
jgi:hypothetical protein